MNYKFLSRDQASKIMFGILSFHLAKGVQKTTNIDNHTTINIIMLWVIYELKETPSIVTSKLRKIVKDINNNKKLGQQQNSLLHDIVNGMMKMPFPNNKAKNALIKKFKQKSLKPSSIINCKFTRKSCSAIQHCSWNEKKERCMNSLLAHLSEKSRGRHTVRHRVGGRKTRSKK